MGEDVAPFEARQPRHRLGCARGPGDGFGNDLRRRERGAESDLPGELVGHRQVGIGLRRPGVEIERRSEEHTSELQSLMRISYAVFCLKKKKKKTQPYNLASPKTTQRNSRNSYKHSIQ